jgi:hypothetical protein
MKEEASKDDDDIEIIETPQCPQKYTSIRPKPLESMLKKNVPVASPPPEPQAVLPPEPQAVLPPELPAAPTTLPSAGLPFVIFDPKQPVAGPSITSPNAMYRLSSSIDGT